LILFEVGGIGGRKKSAFVVIEPPRDFRRAGILEIDDGVFVAGEIGLIEEGAGPVDEATELVGGAGVDALLVETAE
jgi:hypothetical protein